MIPPDDTIAVVHLDLRSGAAEIDSPEVLRTKVARRLGSAGLPEPDHPLFLVVDTPAGLTDHQRQYELLTTYRALGKIRILVLLVGSAPGSYAREGEAFLPDRRLVRPAVLRASGIALLWAGDLRSARTALEQLPPDDPDALAVLVDVLSVPDVFLRMVDDVSGLPDAVAAPGVRLLEQDLPPEVRDRAWRDALARFAGEDHEPAAAGNTLSGAELPEPLRGLVEGRGGRDMRHRTPGGDADQAYHACAQALERAEDDVTALRSLPGLLARTRLTALEEDLEEAHRALGSYRELVAGALRSDGGSGAPPSAAEASARLAALGLHVPSADGVGDRIGEGLREFAGKLLHRGLALRAVAQRFTVLAGQVEPVPGASLLPRIDAHSADRVARRTAAEGVPLPPPAVGASVAAGAAGALGALWQGPLAALAALVPLAFVAAALCGAARLRDVSRPGGTARPPLGPPVAAALGAVAGVVTAYAAGTPLWAGTAGLLLAAGTTVETVRRLWRATADSWAAGRGTVALREALAGLDGLLARLVREHWAAEERLYCADAARSVAGMLRATADAADAEALVEPGRPRTTTAPAQPPAPAPEPAADDWLRSPSTLEAGAYGDADDADTEWARAYALDERPAGAPEAAVPHQAEPADSWDHRPARLPRWLHRETGEGGPDLVATLAGDLTDAAMDAMDAYWGAVERGQAGALAARNTEDRVRELLSDARIHLQRNGVLAAPRFAAAHRVRAGSANLLGTDPHRVASLVGAESERNTVVQLSSPEQGALLSRDPAAAVWVRFAPEAVRTDVETAWRANGAAQHEEPLWTATGRYAGLIRLTPLRMGVVDTVRPRHGAEPETGDADLYAGRDGEGW
ncbi:hypothetical protein [Streptomyces genisteinicus]|uniref:Uncharacterized protein n=1 Tax=Streptomyces genisteinicus TaxID=2768068 RepID=A0A7H0HU81_9ACTN|nr:hypothetical protein [Streptomyces genisteinicus]QNP64097.1 hypothetical protein IAG43_15065 [Streptomyces genisteinicus]